jgi:hypothetical protein
VILGFDPRALDLLPTDNAVAVDGRLPDGITSRPALRSSSRAAPHTRAGREAALEGVC